jgi:hypothetical protein
MNLVRRSLGRLSILALLSLSLLALGAKGQVSLQASPSTLQVSIKSLDDQQWNVWNPSTKDLGATVTATYTEDGQRRSKTQNTPFSIHIDQDTQITVTAGWLSGWSFIRWNWYGDAYYDSSSTWNTGLRGSKPSAYDAYFLAALYGLPGQQRDDAVVVSHTLPSSMISGQSYQVSVTVRNTGTTTWSSDAANDQGYFLGLVDDWSGDAIKFGGNDPQVRRWPRIAVSGAVTPGQDYVFYFVMTAPASGTYRPSYGMVREGFWWFGKQASESVTVSPAEQSFDFDLSIEPGSLAVKQGDIASCVVTASLRSGMSQAILLGVGPVPPSGMWYELDPYPTLPPFTTKLRVCTSFSTPPGRYTVTVSASGGGVFKSASVIVDVAPKDAKTTTRQTATSATSTYATGTTPVQSIIETAIPYTPNAVGATRGSMQPIVLGIIVGLVVSAPISVYRHRRR